MSDDDTRKKDDDGKEPEVPKGALPKVRPAWRKPTRIWPDLTKFHEQEAGYKGKEFTEIGVNVPVLMTPVRLETRIDIKKAKLRLRIFPDQLNVRREDAQPSAGEWTAGRHFWKQFRTTADHATRRAVLEQLIQSVGAQRAGHILELTKKEKARQSAKAVPTRAATMPTLVALPRRWIAIGYSLDMMGFYEESADVDVKLQTGLPDRNAANVTMVNGVPVTPQTKWMVDFEDAKTRGMAMEINLRPEIMAAGEISSMIVFGVAGGPYRDEDAEQIKALLAYHERANGLGFVPQGAVTNNLRGAPTEWRFEDADLDRMLAHLAGDRPTKQKGSADELQTLLGLGEVPSLTRARHAANPERAQARAMNRALFEVAFGTFMRKLLPAQGNTADPAMIDAMRDWFITHVTGGAPVCTLRVGAQPYGFLPVTDLPHSVFSLPLAKDTETHVENAVTLLREEWLNALDQVDLLDPNAIDRRAARARPASSIPALLASQPHPARLFARRFFDGQNTILTEYERALEKLYDKNPDLYALFDARRYAFDNARDIDGQIAVWGRLHFDVHNQRTQTVPWRDKAKRDVAQMLALLGRFEQRQRPLKSIEKTDLAGILGKPLSAYLAAMPDDQRFEFDTVPLVNPQDDKTRTAPQAYLAQLARTLRDLVAKGTDKWPGFKAEPSGDLLFELIVSGFDQLSGKRRMEDMAEALELLSTTASADDLDRLARETLGLASHRLDAWYTSLATMRIKRMRSFKEYKTGLSLGAYGWLTDLKFDAQSVSNGFMHAPSLPLAATAAVLRSGFLAHGSRLATSPGAVDVSSARIRLAHELLGGVRNGQPVGTLLGYLFERALRDASGGLSGDIRDIRQMVIAETKSDATPDEPVDGMALLELHKARSQNQIPLLSDKDLKPHFARLEEVFDAVHDAALFEGTHAATTGKTDHATAVFEAINQGSQLPPEFRAQRTDRHGTTVDHRLMLVLPAAKDGLKVAANGWETGLRDKLAPELELWLHRMLPNPAETRFTVEGKYLALADLKISALDALYLMDEDPTALSAALRVLSAEALGLDHDDFDPKALNVDLAPDKAGIMLEEFQLLTIELRGLLDAGSPLDADGLATRGTTGHAGRTGTSLALARINSLAQTLTAATDKADWGTIARFGIAGGGRNALQERAARLLDLVADKQQGGRTPPQEMAALLFGRATSVLVAFTMPATPDRKPPIDFFDSLRNRVGAGGWLEKVGAVRPTVGRLTMALMLGDMLGIDPPTFQIGQDKRLAGEGWAAISRPPDGSGGRLCAVSLSDAAPPEPGGSAVGLMLDQWSERIPAKDQMTGVSFQFDAPSSKPPQAVLLTAPSEQIRVWRIREMAKILFDTLQFSALRMVQPEHLTDFGAVLPTIYAPPLDHLKKKTAK